MTTKKLIQSKLWSKFYECACGTEGIMISNESWNESNDPDPEIYLAFFNQSFENKKLTWHNRFRNCWRTLTTGLPWCDMVILKKHEAKKLGEDLLKWSSKTPLKYPTDTIVTTETLKKS